MNSLFLNFHHISPGWARGIDADRLHFSVQFEGFAEASFAPSELRRSPLQKDTLVTWTLHYEDVPKGTVASADLSDFVVKSCKVMHDVAN